MQWMFISPLFHPEEILERLRAKKEEELEEVKRQAAEEALKARLEQEKDDVDVEKGGNEDGKLTDSEEQQVVAVSDETTKEEDKETNEEAEKEKNDAVKTGGKFSQWIVSQGSVEKRMFNKGNIKNTELGFELVNRYLQVQWITGSENGRMDELISFKCLVLTQ